MSKSKMKSDTSRRTLPLCNDMIAYLQSVKEKTEENKKVLDIAYNHTYDDYICVNDAGDLMNPDYITSAFHKVLIDNNLRLIRFHDLRHSCATLLYTLGYDMKDIQVWLGHSDFTITANTYTHTNEKNKISMIESVENALNS